MSSEQAQTQKLSPNKAKQALREKINRFLIDNFDAIEEVFEVLEPKEKVRFYCALLPFGMAKVKPEPEVNTDRLTDEQVNEIFEKLKEVANKQIEATLADTGPLVNRDEDS
jgi:hypothetical protein